nr:7TM diverse intracellular signaling domain-containing protein [Thalassolituus maritimus]
MVSESGVVQSFYTGDQRGFHSRPVDQRTFLFPLEKLNQSTDAKVYFRISTPGPLLIPFSLVTGAESRLQDRNTSMALGIYFGILLIMFAYNAFISGSLRDTAYIYYLVYMASVGLHQLTLQGLGYQYFWPDTSLFDNNFAVALSSALVQGTAVSDDSDCRSSGAPGSRHRNRPFHR